MMTDFAKRVLYRMGAVPLHDHKFLQYEVYMLQKRMRQLLHDRFMKHNKDVSVSMYTYTLEGRTELKLCQMAGELDRTKHQLEIEKAKSSMFEKLFLEKTQEIIKMGWDAAAASDKKCDCTAGWYIEQFARVSKENEELRKNANK